MRQQHCSFEDAVAKAAGSGQPPEQWPRELAAHARECGECRELAQAARWMQALASSEGRAEARAEERPLPGAERVWLRAQFAERGAKKEHTEKIRGALEWAQLVLAAGVPVALASWVAWNWFAIAATAEDFLLGAWPQLAGAGYALASLAPAALTLAALALAYPIGALD